MQTGERPDLAIVGGGCAGLSLARRLADRRPDVRVLLLEKRPRYERDRTWCFWDVYPHGLDALVTHDWPRWSVIGPRGETVHESRAHSYRRIPAGNFYDWALKGIRAADHMAMHQEVAVAAIRPRAGHVRIETDAGVFTALHALDCRPPEHAPRFVQAFRGLEIKLDRQLSDPGKAVLMDFRVPQEGGVHFLYMLPFGPDTALIEDTLIAPKAAHPPDRAGITAYVRERLGAAVKDVLFEEKGVIPMDPDVALRPAAPRLASFGARGGAVRGSTGFGFLTMQRMADAFTDAYDPAAPALPHIRARPAWMDWMDHVFLSMLEESPERGAALFARLFRSCPTQALARFLGDAASLRDAARVADAMPFAPFFVMALRTAARGGRR